MVVRVCDPLKQAHFRVLERPKQLLHRNQKQLAESLIVNSPSRVLSHSAFRAHRQCSAYSYQCYSTPSLYDSLFGLLFISILGVPAYLKSGSNCLHPTDKCTLLQVDKSSRKILIPSAASASSDAVGGSKFKHLSRVGVPALLCDPPTSCKPLPVCIELFDFCQNMESVHCIISHSLFRFARTFCTKAASRLDFGLCFSAQYFHIYQPRLIA
ncbi:hypothetical protein F5880DRAFT_1300947 [Lentinula raphanica]|nr:hypothetical protein F5880DRAFT_1300947 [Lentinula raphanica]